LRVAWDFSHLEASHVVEQTRQIEGFLGQLRTNPNCALSPTEKRRFLKVDRKVPKPPREVKVITGISNMYLEF
jgi:hypothetical protein